MLQKSLLRQNEEQRRIAALEQQVTQTMFLQGNGPAVPNICMKSW